MMQTSALARAGVRPPAMGVSSHPLQRLRSADMKEVAIGATISSLKPDTRSPLRCFVNGAPLFPFTPRQWAHHLRLLDAGRADDARRYLARAGRRGLNWEQTRTQVGDVITWHEVPGDKDTLRTVLQIAVLVASIYTGGTTGALIGLFGNVAIGLFLAPSTPTQDAQAQGGTVYSTSLTGNQARLDQPIWKTCGVNRITPPFAGQPYGRYVDTDGDGLDADQYYYVVLCLGIGRHELIRTFIGDTPIEQLQDVITFNHLRAGEQPRVAQCNIEVSEQVTGIELQSDGKYGGPFVACQPRRRVDAVEIDMSATQGLGTSTGPITVTWRVEYAEVDDQGRLISGWNVIANESRTAETNTPQRWTTKYGLAAAVRPLVRVVRTDIKNTAPDARAALSWIGLKGYLSLPAPLDEHAEHLEIVIRASEQLNNRSQSDISVLLQGCARTWNPDTGWSCELGDYANYTPTRNPAWWEADLWADPVWGEGLPDERIDLPTLYELSLLWDERQDHFDHTFDSTLNARDAAQLIARVGRAKTFQRFGVNTLARDQLETLPVTGYSPRNTTPNSMRVDEAHPNRTSADGILLEYTSNVSWNIDTIPCPAPGFTVPDEDDPRYDPSLPKMTRPVYVRMEGIRGAKHAEREGLYQAAAMTLRTRTWSCTTAAQGQIPCVLDPVRWQPQTQGYEQSGDVAFWDPVTLVMGLTEKPVFSEGDTMLTLMRDDGSLTEPIAVTPGPTAWDVTLPAEPDFELVLDNGARERPKFFLGNIDGLGKVMSIKDGGKGDANEGEEGVQLFDLSGFIDDDRVHSRDVHLLPGPGEIQDPVDDGSGGGSSDGTLLLVHTFDHFLRAQYDAAGPTVTFELRNDGTCEAHDSTGNSVVFANEWLQYTPVEASQAGEFEVRFTYVGTLSGGGALGTNDRALNPFSSTDDFLTFDAGVAIAPTGGDALDTWLSIDATRTLVLTASGGSNGNNSAIRVEIRNTASGAIQATRQIWLCAQKLAL